MYVTFYIFIVILIIRWMYFIYSWELVSDTSESHRFGIEFVTTRKTKMLKANIILLNCHWWCLLFFLCHNGGFRSSIAPGHSLCRTYRYWFYSASISSTEVLKKLYMMMKDPRNLALVVINSVQRKCLWFRNPITCSMTSDQWVGQSVSLLIFFVLT